MKGGSFGKSKSEGPLRFSGKGFKGKSASFQDGYTLYPVTFEDAFDATGELHSLGDSESIVDTGATATAGGHQAVQNLCAAVMRARPGARMELYTDDRPWFRFGNGQWGRALFRVSVREHDIEVSLYSLPSPVPVLTGMGDLRKLCTIINCSTGRAIIQKRCVNLRRTRKGHLVINYENDTPRAPPTRHRMTSTVVFRPRRGHKPPLRRRSRSSRPATSAGQTRW